MVWNLLSKMDEVVCDGVVIQLIGGARDARAGAANAANAVNTANTSND